MTAWQVVKQIQLAGANVGKWKSYAAKDGWHRIFLSWPSVRQSRFEQLSNPRCVHQPRGQNNILVEAGQKARLRGRTHEREAFATRGALQGFVRVPEVCWWCVQGCFRAFGGGGRA